MQLSIIVPVYNMAADGKLQFCLESLLHQTVTDMEIIAVDDASTDNSLEVLRDYEKRYPEQLKVIASPVNKKQGGAKNMALDICKGEYIGFVDSDDWVTNDMYEKLLLEAKRTGADIVACDLSRTSEQSFQVGDRVAGINKEAVGAYTPERFERFILDTGHMVIKIYARHIFESPKLRFPEHMFYEDNAIALETIHRAKMVAYVEEPMYFYYQHAGSTVHVISKERCENRMEAMRIMLRLAKEGDYLEDFRVPLEYKFVNLFYQNTLFSYMQESLFKLDFGFLRDMAKEMRDTVPEFEKNPLYLEKVHPEERKFMHLHQKSTVLFVGYYKLLWLYRRLRYGKS